MASERDIDRLLAGHGECPNVVITHEIARLAREAIRERDAGWALRSGLLSEFRRALGPAFVGGDKDMPGCVADLRARADEAEAEAKLAAERERSRKLVDAIAVSLQDHGHSAACYDKCECWRAPMWAVLAEYEGGQTDGE